MSLNIGRKGKLFGKLEAVSYGSTQTLAAANALRHIDFKPSYDPFNRANSPEKKDSPGQVVIFDRRSTASLDSLTALLRPSGTLNTLPEASFLLEAGFGSKTNTILNTTIASGSGIGGATLTSGAGLAVGDAVSIVTAGKKLVRFLTSVAGAVVTWAPNLPSDPGPGAVVKSGITYKLSTDLALSIVLCHYLTGYARELRGLGIDKLNFTFDPNEEPRFVASGPAQKMLNDAATIAQPGSFTSVGGNPPSGIIGDCMIGNTAYLVKKSGVELTNGLMVRNGEYDTNGTGFATEVYRSGRRAAMVSLEAFAETAATLHDLAMAGTVASFFKQTGRTEGNIVAIYCPKVNWSVPDTDTGDEAVNWSFKGTALETADGLNDEVRLALL